MTEETRALEYRRMMTARAANKVAREAALKGSDEDFRRVLAAWIPLVPGPGWTAPGEEDVGVIV